MGIDKYNLAVNSLGDPLGWEEDDVVFVGDIIPVLEEILKEVDIMKSSKTYYAIRDLIEELK